MSVSLVVGDDEGKNTEENGELADAIHECMSKSGRMPVARLLNRLRSEYGIEISAVQLKGVLRDMDVWFDERRGFVYASWRTDDARRGRHTDEKRPQRGPEVDVQEAT